LSLSESLKKLTSLKDFSLDLTWCKSLTDEGIVHICQGLENLPFLQNLSLSLIPTDRAILRLSETLEKISSLQKVDLKFFK